MKTRSGVLTSAIALSVFVPGLAFAYHFNFGALVEDTVIEDNVSFGTERRFTFSRRPIKIPKAYGRLITITASNTGTILWFESQDGLIRNVNLRGGSFSHRTKGRTQLKGLPNSAPHRDGREAALSGAVERKT